MLASIGTSSRRRRNRIRSTGKFAIDHEEITPKFRSERDIQFKETYLDMIELKMGFEQEFDIAIPDEDFDRIQAFDDLVKCLERLKS